MPSWDEEDWIQSARDLISWMQQLGPTQPIMLLIRHSHRDVLKNQKDMLGGGLTDLGKEMSVEMGKKLPTSRSAHFFFSIVPRCYETAEAMAQGFSEMGGKIVDMDPLPSLVRPEYTNDNVWKNLQPNGENITEFINRWADSEFEGIEPFSGYRERLMDDTIGRLLSLKDSQMHIHVTHDLALMAAKRMFFDRPLQWEDREPFLGGLGVTIMETKPILYTAGKEEAVRASLY